MGSAEAVFSAPSAQIAECLGKLPDSERFFNYLRRPVRRDDFADELDFAAQHDQTILAYESPAYPGLLKQIFDPPPLLYTRGSVAVLNEPQLAIVGSRHASTRGFRRAGEFSRELTALGIAVTSGLALGIDQAAHQGAVESNGQTIGVLGNGLNTIYPKSNQPLGEAIISNGGALVSELPPAAAPAARNFPKRNRIISGLALGVLVVEATLKSGSLITARMASEQGREVFAMPGDIDNPHSKGCHRLIRDGAQLTETIDDILGAIAPQLKPFIESGTTPKVASLTPEEQQVYDSVGYASATIDEITVDTRLTAATVSSILLSLELSGLIAGQPGGRYSRT